MFTKLAELIEKRRAQSFVENARAWYQTCNEVSQVMGDALHDQSIINQDIGYIIDAADRLLFLESLYPIFAWYFTAPQSRACSAA